MAGQQLGPREELGLSWKVRHRWKQDRRGSAGVRHRGAPFMTTAAWGWFATAGGISTRHTQR